MVDVAVCCGCIALEEITCDVAKTNVSLHLLAEPVFLRLELHGISNHPVLIAVSAFTR